MTAPFIDQVPASPVKPRRRAERATHVGPVAQGPSARRPGSEAWYHVPGPVRSCVAPSGRVAPSMTGAARPAAVVRHRYEWTVRGLAVLVGAVAAVLGILTTTVLIAFFSVSNAPVTTAAPAQPMVAAGPVLPDARS